MREIDIFATDGYCLDDYGNLISVLMVDFRPQEYREPIGTLLKATRSEHALAECHTIRLSKPPAFRGKGTDLIRDDSEAIISKSTVEEPPQHTIVDQVMQLAVDELENLVRKYPDMFKSISISTTREQRVTDTITAGKNGWIYSTSVKPPDQQSYRKWKASMPAEYDAVTSIYRPTFFARALGFMVAEQLGPRGQIADMTQRFESRGSATSRHTMQGVMHGPVVYTEDPWATVHKLQGATVFPGLSLFVKHMDYAEQGEYRFVVWSEKEPEEEYVDLAVSGMMRDSLQPLR